MVFYSFLLYLCVCRPLKWNNTLNGCTLSTKVFKALKRIFCCCPPLFLCIQRIPRLSPWGTSSLEIIPLYNQTHPPSPQNSTSHYQNFFPRETLPTLDCLPLCRLAEVLFENHKWSIAISHNFVVWKNCISFIISL